MAARQKIGVPRILRSSVVTAAPIMGYLHTRATSWRRWVSWVSENAQSMQQVPEFGRRPARAPPTRSGAPELVLAPRCVESASSRAAALRTATADPPEPGSLALHQELAQLQASAQIGSCRPGSRRSLGSKKGVAGRSRPERPALPGRAGAGTSASAISSLWAAASRCKPSPRGHSLERGGGGLRVRRLTLAPRCRARPYPRGPSRRGSRPYMFPTDRTRGRASSGPCRWSVGSGDANVGGGRQARCAQNLQVQLRCLLARPCLGAEGERPRSRSPAGPGFGFWGLAGTA